MLRYSTTSKNVATPAPNRPQDGSLDVAVTHAFRLLRRDAALARVQAEEILKAAPGYPAGLLVLGAARLRMGDAAAAKSLLAALAKSQPNWASAHFELGLALASLDVRSSAVAAFRRAADLDPGMADAWGSLGDQLTLAGDLAGADQAYAQQIRASANDPDLMQAAVALCDGQLDVAETLLRGRLMERPTDVAAIRMLAEVGARLGRYTDAEALLARCLELAPTFTAARHHYAIVLYRQGKAAEAADEIGTLLDADPGNPNYRSLHAAAMAQIGDYEGSIEAYEELLARYPGQPKGWLSYGHALKTAGRQADSVRAYRRAIELSPSFGEAYWSLANLKTVRLGEGDIAEIGRQLDAPELGEDSRLHLHYALGKALEDAGDFGGSFAHYSAGASIRRNQVAYRADETTAQVARTKSFFSRERLAASQGDAATAGGPIFIVGLPRSGSTLIEQILASHSAVEGTMELPEVGNIVRGLKSAAGAAIAPDIYPACIDALGPDELLRLGERYMANTRIYRKTDRPYFIDKMPNNFLHVGLIQTILPNAKIIDARRLPFAACFSAFKQHFARGQHFSYDLDDLGRYYCDYVDLMAHFDQVVPGRIHRVHYEAMVDDTESEVRRLLEYCQLPFEPACLRFYENARAVRTASSEQVRRPIFRDGLDQWRRFEPWLEPLQSALAPLHSAETNIERDAAAAIARSPSTSSRGGYLQP